MATVTVYPEWWLKIITDMIVDSGWNPPIWFQRFYNDTLFSYGSRMSPSAHTFRRWERLRNEKHE